MKRFLTLDIFNRPAGEAKPRMVDIDSVTEFTFEDTQNEDFILVYCLFVGGHSSSFYYRGTAAEFQNRISTFLATRIQAASRSTNVG